MRPASLAREGAELDQLAVELEAGAEHRLRGEAYVLAKPGRGAVTARRGVDRGEELAEPVARLAVEVTERVEQVAVEQLRVEPRERVGARDVVEAERIFGREQRAGLTWLEREGAAECGERVSRVR